ncbi:hypothetical protein Efla_006929 [Eimeria flavescens]
MSRLAVLPSAVLLSRRASAASIRLRGVALQAHLTRRRGTRASTAFCWSCDRPFSDAVELSRCTEGKLIGEVSRRTGASQPVTAATEAAPKQSSSPDTSTAIAAPTDFWGFAPIPFVARGRSMPGQRLLPCTREDVAILANAETKYPSPQEVDSGIVVRIIAAKDVHNVTSPVLRVVRNRQYGIRKGERLRLALGGAFFSAVLCALGAWQLRRMEEKKNIIEYRRSHLAMQPTVILTSPFPWTVEAALSSEKSRREENIPQGECEDAGGHASVGVERGSEGRAATIQARDAAVTQGLDKSGSGCASADEEGRPPSDYRGRRSGSLLASCSRSNVENALAAWAYRPVVVHGVLDSSTELLVGPRPGLDVGNAGYCVVSPLRLKDGSVLLVNKGHLPVKLAKLPPFHKAVNEDDIAAFVHQQHLQLARARAVSLQQPEEQLDSMQQAQPRKKYVDFGSRQRLEQLQELAGSRTEPIASVTVRGILEPGEIANSSFKSLMLKNRPQDGQFHVVNPKDLAEATPGIPNRAEAGLLIVNAYSIVYDQDVLPSNTQTNTGASDGPLTVANRFLSYQQKQKADYLLFYADENTHFNYACQWFLMALCTAAMTIYKVIEVTRSFGVLLYTLFNELPSHFGMQLLAAACCRVATLDIGKRLPHSLSENHYSRAANAHIVLASARDSGAAHAGASAWKGKGWLTALGLSWQTAEGPSVASHPPVYTMLNPSWSCLLPSMAADSC